MIEKRSKTDQRGFSLMELMIIMAIISILVTPFLYLEIFYTERYHSTMAYQDMAEAGNRTLDWIARDFRASRGILDTWRHKPLAGNRLILDGGDDRVILYAHDEKRKAVTRAEHRIGADGEPPMIVTLAENVDRFEIDPVDPSASVLHLRVRFSRELFHSEDILTMTCITSRRVK